MKLDETRKGLLDWVCGSEEKKPAAGLLDVIGEISIQKQDLMPKVSSQTGLSENLSDQEGDK